MKNNYDIKNDLPNLSTEQINQHKDFDSLFAQFEAAPSQSTVQESVSSENIAVSDASTAVISQISPWVIKTGIGAVMAVLTSVVVILLLQNNSTVSFVPQGQINELLTLEAPLGNAQQKLVVLVLDDAQKGGTLTTNSGTKITVPPSAFVDATGQIITGKVEINYKAYLNSADMFWAGVPQQQDQHLNFQAAAMLHIEGLQNGQNVFLDTSKTLTIALASLIAYDKPTTNFGVYVFSQQTNNWLFHANDNISLNDAANEKGLSAEQKKLLAAAQKKLARKKPTLPQKPKKVPSDMQIFDFKINKKDFPEIAHFSKNTEFVVSKKEVADDPFAKEWHDMTIKSLDNGKAQIKLTREKDNGRTESLKLTITPLIVDSEGARAEYQKQLTVYEQKLKKWNAKVMAIVEKKSKKNLPKWKTIVHNFEINRFGLWNCGQKIEGNTNTPLLAQWVNKKGDSLAIQQVYVAYPQQQIYYYNSPKNIKIDWEQNPKIWALASNKELLVLKQKTEEEETFVLEMIAVKKADWKSKLQEDF